MSIKKPDNDEVDGHSTVGVIAWCGGAERDREDEEQFVYSGSEGDSEADGTYLFV